MLFLVNMRVKDYLKLKELLFSITKKDFKIDYFSGTGAGGQHRNKHQNCVRIQHIESGAIATGQSSRSRKANMKEAFNGIVEHPKFKIWHSRRIRESLTNETIEEIVVKQIETKNLRIEEKIDNKWEILTNRN